MKAYNVRLLKWFMSLMLLMVWSSVTLAKFLSPFMPNACFNPGGDHGLFICQYTENILGAPGLTGILLLTAIAFLTYTTFETIEWIRKLLNPAKFFANRVKFHVTNETGAESMQNIAPVLSDTLEDPKVFDDPEKQEVIFDVAGEDSKQDLIEEEEPHEAARSHLQHQRPRNGHRPQPPTPGHLHPARPQVHRALSEQYPTAA